MKKLALLLGFIGIFGFNIVKADTTVFGFQDGKFYNADQKLVYFCFEDGSCFDVNNNPVVITVNHPAAVTPKETTQVDVCPNIEGIQTVVPTGMNLDSNGNCVTPIPAPVVISNPDPVTPSSCTLTLAHDYTYKASYAAQLTWDSENVPDTAVGYVYAANKTINGIPDFSNNGPVRIVNGSSGVVHNMAGPANDWKLVLGNTVCYGTLPSDFYKTDSDYYRQFFNPDGTMK